MTGRRVWRFTGRATGYRAAMSLKQPLRIQIDVAGTGTDRATLDLVLPAGSGDLPIGVDVDDLTVEVSFHVTWNEPGS